jgi:toxin ParE1/3/4
MRGAPWEVVFSADAVEDFALIEEHLRQAYLGFGESQPAASLHAHERVDALIATAERLSAAPFRGEAHDGLLPGLRHLALDGAIFWFIPVEQSRQVKVLAVFFGGQDHQRHMLVRLLQPQAP